MKLAGKSVEQVIAARPPAATDEAMGKGFIKPDQLVRAVCETL